MEGGNWSVELEEGFRLPAGGFAVEEVAPTDDEVRETAALVVVGAGYTGVNALVAASEHLPRGSRVAVVAKEGSWGGNWESQYDFVRLHQPYQAFTAGSRPWRLEREPDCACRRRRRAHGG